MKVFLDSVALLLVFALGYALLVLAPAFDATIIEVMR